MCDADIVPEGPVMPGARLTIINRENSAMPYLPGFFRSVQIVAHRGAWGGDAPENSLAALRQAKLRRAAAEIDIRLTADKVPILFHDATLARVCGDPRWVSRVPWRSLRKLSLPNGERIPRLADALQAFPQLPLLLDLKHPNEEGVILQVLARAPGRGSNVMLIVHGCQPPAAVRQNASRCLAITGKAMLRSVLRGLREGEPGSRRQRSFQAVAVPLDLVAVPKLAAIQHFGLQSFGYCAYTDRQVQLCRRHGVVPIADRLV